MQESYRIMNKLRSLGKKLKTKKQEKTKQETEDNNGQYPEILYPRVHTLDFHNGLVQVVMLIPGFEPTEEELECKGGRITLDFCNKGRGFDMRTELEDKKKVKTIYKFSISQFPSRVETAKSKWGVEKGKIIITLHKHPEDININWIPMVTSRGLDNSSSSSSDDDD